MFPLVFLGRRIRETRENGCYCRDRLELRYVPHQGSVDQLDDLLEIVRRFDRRVAEEALFVLVVVDRGAGVFEGVAGQDAGDPLILCDDALGQQVL